MGKKHPNAHLALRDEHLIHGVIASLRGYAVCAVQYDIRTEDVVKAIYKPEWLDQLYDMRDTIYDMFHNAQPRYSIQLDEAMLGFTQHPCSVRITLKKDDDFMPLLGIDQWSGPPEAQDKLKAAIKAAADEQFAIRRNWRRVSYVFNELNAAAKSLNMLRSWWPAVQQLAEHGGYEELVASMGAYKPYAPPMHFNAEFMQHVKDTLPIVGMGIILAQAEPPNLASDLIVETY